MRQAFRSRTFTISILFVAAAYLIGIYWWFIDGLFPVDEVIVPPFVSATPLGEPVEAVRAGANIYARWNLNILRRCAADFQRSLVNLDTTEVVTLEMHHGATPKKLGEVEWAQRIRLPARLDTGRWEYRVKAVFSCNPLQPQIEDYPAVAFLIVE